MIGQGEQGVLVDGLIARLCVRRQFIGIPFVGVNRRAEEVVVRREADAVRTDVEMQCAG